MRDSGLVKVHSSLLRKGSLEDSHAEIILPRNPAEIAGCTLSCGAIQPAACAIDARLEPIAP